MSLLDHAIVMLNIWGAALVISIVVLMNDPANTVKQPVVVPGIGSSISVPAPIVDPPPDPMILPCGEGLYRLTVNGADGGCDPIIFQNNGLGVVPALSELENTG